MNKKYPTPYMAENEKRKAEKEENGTQRQQLNKEGGNDDA